MKKIYSLLIVAFLTFPSLAFAFDWSITIGSSSAGHGLDTYLPSGNIYYIVQNIMYWLLGIGAMIAIIGFVISGIMYMTAAGDESRAESAKKAMTYSIIGVIVAGGALVIINAILSALSGGSNTTF